MDELEKKLAKFPEHIRTEFPQMFPERIVQSPEFLKLLDNEKMVYNYFKEDEEDHILATPLADLFSIKIFNYAVDDGIPYEVFGSIEVIDGEGTSFMFYNRNHNMPETICNGDPLTIIFDSGEPIIFPEEITLEINLKARMKGGRVVEIVNGTHIWDQFDFDKVATAQINGVQGQAIVEYIVYRHAVFTMLDVMVDKNETSCNTANIYGTIVAQYGNYTTTIFDQKQSHPVPIEFGAYMGLLKNLLAVPAYLSYLTIRAHLWNADTNTKIVDSSENFKVFHCTSRLRTTLEGVQLLLHWKHAYMVPHMAEPSNANILSDPKKFKVSSDQPSQPIFLGNRKPMEVMEVFSIAIYGNTDEEINLWGSIRISGHSAQAFTLFYQDKENPTRVVPNQTLSITFPTECIVYPGFIIRLDLKDTNDRIISLGVISWDDELLTHPISWLNRPLCSVVRGNDDFYAVMHYSVFSAACQAMVQISLIDKTSSMKDAQIVGCVLAQYNIYKYVTLYDKEFYRRKLFTQTSESSKKFVNSRITLGKSVVAVPAKSSLIVDVNLKILSNMMKTPEVFEKQLDFKPDMGNKMRQTVELEVHQIVVEVDWSEKMF